MNLFDNIQLEYYKIEQFCTTQNVNVQFIEYKQIIVQTH